LLVGGSVGALIASCRIGGGGSSSITGVLAIGVGGGLTGSVASAIAPYQPFSLARCLARVSPVPVGRTHAVVIIASPRASVASQTA
jgi:hypothetical protein